MTGLQPAGAAARNARGHRFRPRLLFSIQEYHFRRRMRKKAEPARFFIVL